MFIIGSSNFKVVFSKRWDNGRCRKEVIPIALQYRHEWKHEISRADLMALRPRLRAVLTPDRHGAGGKYTIRSLYFDDPWDTALRQKLDGVDRRDKFRIRLYDGDESVIHLEKKSKRGGLCQKSSAPLTAEETQSIVDGRIDWMADSPHDLIRELHHHMTSRLLRPMTIVDYTREAFVYGPGNVRVTLDYGIRTGLRCTEVLNADCLTVPVKDDPVILEVKWDEFLPDIVRDAVQLRDRRAAAFSKYAACRMYD